MHNAWKIGSVGRPMLGTVSKVDPNTGELSYSGRHIFAGYLGMEEKTQETISADGFMHSGDVVKVSLQPMLIKFRFEWFLQILTVIN